MVTKYHLSKNIKRLEMIMLFILYSFPYRPFMHFTFRLRSNLNNSKTCNFVPLYPTIFAKSLKVLFSLQMQNIQSTNYTPLCVQCLNWNGYMQTRVSNYSSVNELQFSQLIHLSCCFKVRTIIQIFITLDKKILRKLYEIFYILQIQ